jgi:4-carboxymuconolactone decarboxylase
LARVSKPDRGSLPHDERRFFDAVHAIRRRPISGPFIVLSNASPNLAARFAHLGHYFHARGQADESIVPIHVRCFVSLIGSRLLESPYEWAAWVNWSLDAGVAQATVDAIREGREPALDPTERLVNDFCGALVSGDHRVGDALFADARAHFGDQGLVELVVTLGYFAMIALPLNAFEMQMSPEQIAQRKPFEPLRVRGKPWSAGERRRESPPALVEERSGARLPPLTQHDDLTGSNQHFLDRVIRSRGWISPLFAVLLHTPDVAERIAHIGEYILYDSGLPPQTRALVSLLAARELDAPYTWAAATAMAEECAFDATLVPQLADGALRAASDDERLTATYCLQLLRSNHHVADDVHERMLDRFGLPATIQVAALAGYVAMTSIIATAFELQPPRDSSRPLL